MNNINHLCGLEKYRFLRKLDLSNNRLTSLVGIGMQCNVFYEFFVTAQVSELEILHLSGNGLRDTSGFEQLSSLPNLKVLDLSWNQISSIAFTRYITRVRTLDLRGNPVCEFPNYRQYITGCLPNLIFLNDLPVKEPEPPPIIPSLASLDLTHDKKHYDHLREVQSTFYKNSYH